MTEEQLAILRGRLNATGSARVKVGGWSMWPFLREGDVLLLNKQAPPYRFGAVVGALAGTQFIAHRVVGSKGGQYLIRGDYAPGSASWIEARDILGVVTSRERRGRASRFWLMPPGFWMAVWLSVPLLWLRRPIGRVASWKNWFYHPG